MTDLITIEMLICRQLADIIVYSCGDILSNNCKNNMFAVLTWNTVDILSEQRCFKNCMYCMISFMFHIYMWMEKTLGYLGLLVYEKIFLALISS